MREKAIAAGFQAFGMTGLHHVMRPWTQGRGAILMFHHVRPFASDGFAPNRLLEITPAFLDAALTHLRERDFEIVCLDEALQRLARPPRASEPSFAVLTFDDGYRDNLHYALPVLEAHQAPFTLYVCNGFASRTAPLWWLDLEAAIRKLDQIVFDAGKGVETLASSTLSQKSGAFAQIYWQLRQQDEAVMRKTIADLANQARINPLATVAELCLDWDEIRALSQHKLCTIGVHTMSHPMLAKHPIDMVIGEISASRTGIEMQLGLSPRHLSYPVGDPTSAGPREFDLAKRLGFQSAVTTRPGMILEDHASRSWSLPRLSVNGKWQSLKALDVLLSGAPFALINRFRPA